MKTLLINFLIFCFSQNTFGQLSGKVITGNGQPISFVNVLLLKGEDSVVTKAVLTDEKGIYNLENIEPGQYILRLSSAGYQALDLPLFELTGYQKKNLGVQALIENTKQLDEVIVRVDKPLFQQQAYGMVVNVESSVLTKGSSALQVLERSPGVVIDYRNNGIALNGKNGVTVMLNGKPMHLPIDQLVTLLNGMSADDIEKIELLATPPVKYDAEGSAGVINIVLKKNKRRGTNGTLSISAGYGWKEKATGSISLAHNTAKIDLYGSYTFSHDRSYSYLVGQSSQNFPALGGQMNVLFWNTAKPLQNSHDVTLGVDARLTPKTTAGFNIAYNSSNISSSSFNRREFNVLPDSLLLFTGDLKAINHWGNLVSSLYAEKTINEGEKLNMELNYLYYKSDNAIDVQSTFVDKNGNQAGTNNDTSFSPRQKGLASTIIRVGVGKIDYLKQVSDEVKIEAGLKGTYTKSFGLSGIQSLVNGQWINRQETANDIVMTESIGAAYVSVNTKLNESANLVLGLRYEYAHTDMDNAKMGGNGINRRPGALFPGIFFTKKLNNNSELQLSYTKRISRPSYNDLSSFIAYNDPVSVFTGNPLLKPTITNNLKVGYNYGNYSFSILLSRDDNPIVRYQITASPEGSLLFISPQNLTYQNNLVLQINAPFKINSWWNMSYNFTGGLRHFKADYTIHPFEKTYFGYSVNFNESFRLPWKSSLEISGWYNAASLNGTIKTGEFVAVNAGIKKVIKNNGGTFQLSVTDLLNTIRYKSYYGALTEEPFDGSSAVTYNPESRKAQIIKLTYLKSFGNNKGKLQRSAAGTNDERERIRTQ